MSDTVTSESDITLTPSTCCYCGVGCGVLIETQDTPSGPKIIGVRGDPTHPANFGKLCTKGLNLALTVANDDGRLLQPEIRLSKDQPRRTADWDDALSHVSQRIAQTVQTYGPDSLAFYVSGQLLTEDYYVFNKIAKGLIGTNNIDTNSRLCMSSAVVGYKKALGADGPPTCYEDLDQADCVLFAGSNMAYAHPVLFRRLEVAKAERSQKWIVVDPRRTDTAAMADLHLAIQPGTDVALFNAMLHHLIWEDLIDQDYIAARTEGFAELKKLVRDYTPRMVADICGVPASDIMTAAEWFGRSPASLSLYCMGLNQSAHGTDKNLALIHLHLATAQIGKPGAGPFSLTGQPNAMGGREVGGMATMLAAHRDYANPDHRAEVARLWNLPDAQVISSTPGLPAVAMFEAVRDGRIKALYIVCTNPAHSLPNLPLVHEALATCPFVVVQDCFSNIDTMAYADVALPATGWGEKEGTVTNSERRISRVRAAVPARGLARGDWDIARELGQRLQRLLHPEWPALFDWSDSAAIFNEHALLTAGRDLDITGINHELLMTHGPQQWPYPASANQAQARRYTDGTFATDNGKARFHPTPYQPTAEKTNARYPFHLLTGRLRDQWHGMSRTGRVASLFQHTPEPQLTMNPQDMILRDLKSGQLVRISSKRGSLVLPLTPSDDVKPGTVFAAMHWSGQFLNSTGINEIALDAVCPQSFQPELKHAAVRITDAELPWRCLAAWRISNAEGHSLHDLQTRLQPLLKECGYAALTFPSTSVMLLRAAYPVCSESWLDRLSQALGLDQTTADCLHYQDRRRGIVKRIAWQGAHSKPSDESAHLQGFIYTGVAGSDDLLAAESLLTRLMDDQPWVGPRLAAFNPKAGASTQPRDRVICNCKQVKESQIMALHQQGESLPSIQSQLGCGTVCGSCVPELKRLLA